MDDQRLQEYQAQVAANRKARFEWRAKIWTNRFELVGWPLDHLGHVFLGNAVCSVGVHLYGSRWTSDEATMLMPDPLPPWSLISVAQRRAEVIGALKHKGKLPPAYVDDHREISPDDYEAARQIVDEVRATVERADRRWIYAIAKLKEMLVEGVAKAVLQRPAGGSYSNPLPQYAWVAHNPEVTFDRFTMGMMRAAEDAWFQPFDWTRYPLVNKDEDFRWIYIEKVSLDAALIRLVVDHIDAEDHVVFRTPEATPATSETPPATADADSERDDDTLGKATTIVAKGVETEAPRAEISPIGRTAPQQLRVKRKLDELFPQGIPGRDLSSDVELVQIVQNSFGSIGSVPSRDTILRAAGRK